MANQGVEARGSEALVTSALSLYLISINKGVKGLFRNNRNPRHRPYCYQVLIILIITILIILIIALIIIITVMIIMAGATGVVRLGAEKVAARSFGTALLGDLVNIVHHQDHNDGDGDDPHHN